MAHDKLSAGEYGPGDHRKPQTDCDKHLTEARRLFRKKYRVTEAAKDDDNADMDVSDESKTQ